MSLSERELAQLTLQLLDLTSLNDTDNEETITQLCNNARCAQGHVAAVCVYPKFVAHAQQQLAGSSVKIATVAWCARRIRCPAVLRKGTVSFVLVPVSDFLRLLFVLTISLSIFKPVNHASTNQCFKYRVLA